MDGVVAQSDPADLVFGPEHLVEYISHITTLHPDEVIPTGTADGVGPASRRNLPAGSGVEVSIGLGTPSNVVAVD